MTAKDLEGFHVRLPSAGANCSQSWQFLYIFESMASSCTEPMNTVPTLSGSAVFAKLKNCNKDVSRF